LPGELAWHRPRYVLSDLVLRQFPMWPFWGAFTACFLAGRANFFNVSVLGSYQRRYPISLYILNRIKFRLCSLCGICDSRRRSNQSLVNLLFLDDLVLFFEITFVESPWDFHYILTLLFFFWLTLINRTKARFWWGGTRLWFVLDRDLEGLAQSNFWILFWQLFAEPFLVPMAGKLVARHATIFDKFWLSGELGLFLFVDFSVLTYIKFVIWKLIAINRWKWHFPAHLRLGVELAFRRFHNLVFGVDVSCFGLRVFSNRWYVKWHH